MLAPFPISILTQLILDTDSRATLPGFGTYLLYLLFRQIA